MPEVRGHVHQTMAINMTSAVPASSNNHNMMEGFREYFVELLGYTAAHRATSTGHHTTPRHCAWRPAITRCLRIAAHRPADYAARACTDTRTGAGTRALARTTGSRVAAGKTTRKTAGPCAESAASKQLGCT